MYLQYHLYLRTTVMVTLTYYTLHLNKYKLSCWVSYMCSVYHVKWTFCFRLSYTHNKGYNAVMILVMALLSRPEWRHLALGMSGPVFLLLLWQQNEEIWENEVPPLMLQTWRHKHPLTHTHLEHIYSTALVVTCLCQDQVTAASVSVGRLEG